MCTQQSRLHSHALLCIITIKLEVISDYVLSSLLGRLPQSPNAVRIPNQGWEGGDDIVETSVQCDMLPLSVVLASEDMT